MKIQFNKRYLRIGLTAFLVVAASICFYYLIFHGDRFSAQLHALIWHNFCLSYDTYGKWAGKPFFNAVFFR